MEKVNRKHTIVTVFLTAAIIFGSTKGCSVVKELNNSRNIIDEQNKEIEKLKSIQEQEETILDKTDFEELKKENEELKSKVDKINNTSTKPSTNAIKNTSNVSNQNVGGSAVTNPNPAPIVNQLDVSKETQALIDQSYDNYVKKLLKDDNNVVVDKDGKGFTTIDPKKEEERLNKIKREEEEDKKSKRNTQKVEVETKRGEETIFRIPYNAINFDGYYYDPNTDDFRDYEGNRLKNSDDLKEMVKHQDKIKKTSSLENKVLVAMFEGIKEQLLKDVRKNEYKYPTIARVEKPKVYVKTNLSVIKSSKIIG